MKRFACLVFLVAASAFAADYTMTLEREHVVLEKPTTLTLGGAPESIRLERAGGTIAEPLLVATRLDGSCVPGALDATGCDELRVDFRNGQLEFRSFARSKGIRAQLEGLDGVWETAPLRIASTPRKTQPALSIAITTSRPETLRFAAKLDTRDFTRTVEHRGSTYPASVAPLLLLLHEVIASTDRVARTKEVGTTEPTPSGGGGGSDSCAICSLCKNLPGGSTLGGCLGLPGGGGLLGGGGGKKTPKACTISIDEALRVFGDVLRLDAGVTVLCTGTLGATSPRAIFDSETAKFKHDFDTTPTSDAESKDCALCFQLVAHRYESSGGGTGSLQGILKPKCINSYAKLKDPANASEYASVFDQAKQFRDDLAGCKRTCDSGPPSPAAHRTYCGCGGGFLTWEPTGPRPSTPACPP
jgi:hypothetical protein